MLIYNERSQLSPYKSIIPTYIGTIHSRELDKKTTSAHNNVLRPENIQFLRSLKLKVVQDVEHKTE